MAGPKRTVTSAFQTFAAIQISTVFNTWVILLVDTAIGTGSEWIDGDTCLLVTISNETATLALHATAACVFFAVPLYARVILLIHALNLRGSEGVFRETDADSAIIIVLFTFQPFTTVDLAR